MTAVLTLERVGHAYDGVPAVRALSLEVAAGEVVCLLGPSGCGKTTALRLAAGLEHLQQGRVLMEGRVVAGEGREVPPESRGIGLVFQDFALFPHLRILENVAFGLAGRPAPERRTRAIACLEQVGMADYADSFPHALSGGQQQRVALARALAPEPRLMLMDEPFSGLDVRLRDAVRDQTLAVLKINDAATLLVTHDPEEAMFMADRIALMRDGRLVQVGSPSELYLQPVDGFAAGFFGDLNRIEAVAGPDGVPSPLGPIAAPGFAPGSPAVVLIRPEALSLDDRGVPARAVSCRMLGRSTLVLLDIDGQRLRARLPGQVVLPPDQAVRVRLDPRQAFVFEPGRAT